MIGTRLYGLGLCAGLLFAFSGCSGGNSSKSETPKTVATPVFSPPGGSYGSTQSVIISDATSNATIYFTTDGSTPTRASKKYGGPVSVAVSTTLKAIATATVMNDSAIAISSYVISSSGHTYSTTFPNTEDPISENGHWINGGVNGLSWNNCRTNSGFAFGNQPGTILYDDSICAMTGSWGTNQSVESTVQVNTTGAAMHEEVEVFLNLTITANQATGYEINCSVVPGNGYVQIVRWNGAFGDFTVLESRGTTGCATGDVLKATNVGGVITVYKNGVPAFSVNDTSYTNGSPGMGFYIDNPSTTADAANSSFGFSAYSASD